MAVGGINTSKPHPRCQSVCSGSAMTGWQLETSSPGPVTSGGGARGWPGVSSCQQSASNQPQPTPVIFFNLPPTIGQWSSPTLTLIYIDIPYVFKHPFVIVFSHVLVYISEYSEYQCTMYNEQLIIYWCRNWSPLYGSGQVSERLPRHTTRPPRPIVRVSTHTNTWCVEATNTLQHSLNTVLTQPEHSSLLF